MAEAVDLTAASLNSYGPTHDHWAVAWSGGKDSTATLTLLVHLIRTGRVKAPKSLRVFYADTRMELPPLYFAAQQIMSQLRQAGIAVEVVTAALDKRFFVYMLGRGVPPPNNRTLRWCTAAIKVLPMQHALEKALAGIDGQVLMITGVREGESAMRDQRIRMSCGKDGAECGQGWYQQALPHAKGLRERLATLAPLLHWRVCHVWDWLLFHAAPDGFRTDLIALCYGGDEAQEINARTGCVGCPLAEVDTALDYVLTKPSFAYLAPMKELRPLYRRLRQPENRLRKPEPEVLKDGRLAKNPQRLGPLTFAARRSALAEVMDIQARCNALAPSLGQPPIDILNDAEVARVQELIAAETWPDGWGGDEPTGDVPLPAYFADGTMQGLLL